MTKLFVDGAYGTVASAVNGHLLSMKEKGKISEIIQLTPDQFKVDSYRLEAMAAADIVLICVPDNIARNAVEMVKLANPRARIIDTSAAHRCHRDWVYGLEELPYTPIEHAQYVANPGCFATGCILLAYPLYNEIDRLDFYGITGYSAAGKTANKQFYPQLTKFGAVHRHIAEIEMHAGMAASLTTMVGNWERGMLIQATIPANVEIVESRYRSMYSGSVDISIERAYNSETLRLSPLACNFSNRVKIAIAGADRSQTSVAIAFDNLGKGSAGTAARNLELMIG